MTVFLVTCVDETISESVSEWQSPLMRLSDNDLVEAGSREPDIVGSGTGRLRFTAGLRFTTGSEVDCPDVDCPDVEGPDVEGPDVEGPDVDGPGPGIS